MRSFASWYPVNERGRQPSSLSSSRVRAIRDKPHISRRTRGQDRCIGARARPMHRMHRSHVACAILPAFCMILKKIRVEAHQSSLRTGVLSPKIPVHSVKLKNDAKNRQNCAPQGRASRSSRREDSTPAGGDAHTISPPTTKPRPQRRSGHLIGLVLKASRPEKDVVFERELDRP